MILRGLYLLTFMLSNFAWGVETTQCSNVNEVLKNTNYMADYLTFENFAARFRGRCRGHVIVTQKSHYLFQFNTGENPNNCGPENMSTECKQLYFDKIKTMMFEEKVVEIPGFKTWRNFLMMDIFNPFCVIMWPNTPSTFKTVRAKLRFNEFTQKKNTFLEIMERVKENKRPYVAINHWKLGDHALWAIELSTKDDQDIICVRDPNVVPNPGHTCENYLYTKVITYERPTADPEVKEKEDVEEVLYHRRVLKKT
jgi:hypothetical protein